MAGEDGISPQTGAFVLSYRDVAKLLSGVHLGQFITRLAEEIEVVYRDQKVESVDRLGWSRFPDALEIMGCQAADFTCTKLISSVPGGNGSPTVTGTLVCTEVGTDQARLVCDAAFLTPLRTATTTAVVMRRVAPQARSLGIIGAGLEGIAHAVVLTFMSDSIETIRLLDVTRGQAAQAAEEASYLLGRNDLLGGREVHIDVCEDEREMYETDAVVTATFAEGDVLKKVKSTRDGTFIAAVGADLESKRELAPRLYDKAKFIADDLRQCLREGELQYAKKRTRGVARKAQEIRDHRGELADGRIVSATRLLEDPKPFLERGDPITIYDSTGFSGQDLAVARVMLEALEGCDDLKRQRWNPSGSRSLIELLGCNPNGADAESLPGQAPSKAQT
jgi:ornithine cyclodeaminase/alanine dehydrogenase-like protein (mu-crystallin family)